MLRAIDLAWHGWGRVQPNPMVGAVVLNDGAIVGEGFHEQFGERHAERIALDNAGPEALGGTLVVTLEPCCHHGKQPPCVDAVIAAGIERVVMAMPDPNPAATGGAARLVEAGLDVDTGLLAPQAACQNAAFLHQFRNPNRPWVALKLATSMDHRIADRRGKSQWVSGREARDYVHRLRAGFDAIGVGAATIRSDDPQLTVRGSVEARIAPARIVFTRSGDVPRESSVVATAHQVPTWVVHVGRERGAGDEASPDPHGIRHLHGRSVEEALAAVRAAGITSILVEGGGALAGSLLDAGLVDRFYWVQSPLWLGDDGMPATRGITGALLGEGEEQRWTVTERRALGQDTLLVLDREPCSPG